MDYDWVEREINGILTTRRKRRIQSGIDHLPNKKLYKYYSFSSEYTLSNIENDLIYLQNPIEFNDPFDCNIGISVNQLIRLCVPNLFDNILPTATGSVKEALWSCLLGDSVSELPDGSKGKLLSLLTENPAFKNLIKKAEAGETISEQECKSFFISNPKLAAEMLQMFFSLEAENGSFSLDESDLQKIIRIPQILKNLIVSVANPKNEKELQLIKILISEDDFLRKIVAFASDFGIDIPKEDIFDLYVKLDEGLKKVRKGIGESVGIECFTQSPTDVLMWSYYANKHSGICVEYDFSKLFSSLSDAYLFPVIYSENRPLLNLERIYDPVSQQYINENMRDEFPNIAKAFITKSSEWDREKEWRIVSFSMKNDYPDRKAKLPIISKIITGINIRDEDYSKIKDIAARKAIPIQRAQLNNEQYRIELINEK